MLDTVNAELPLLLIVSVRVAVVLVTTLPNARLPLNPMIRLGAPVGVIEMPHWFPEMPE